MALLSVTYHKAKPSGAKIKSFHLQMFSYCYHFYLKQVYFVWFLLTN